MPQVKTLGKGDVVFGLIGYAAGFRRGAAHGEGPGRTPDQGEIKFAGGGGAHQAGGQVAVAFQIQAVKFVRGYADHPRAFDLNGIGPLRRRTVSQ